MILLSWRHLPRAVVTTVIYSAGEAAAGSLGFGREKSAGQPNAGAGTAGGLLGVFRNDAGGLPGSFEGTKFFAGGSAGDSDLG